MIRPMTCLSLLVAAGSGLYLYQAKHDAHVLDRQIEQVMAATARVREHIGVLRAEYALLNDPSRLQDLAAAHLPALAPLAPGQFTTLAELDQRLPQIGPPPASPASLDVAAPAAPDEAPIGARSGSVPYDFPPAPSPMQTRALVASLAGATLHAAAPTPARRLRTATASVAKPAPRRVAAFAPAFRAAPRPDPLAIQAAAASVPQVASALGMARTLMTPATVSYYQRYRPGASETLGR